MGCGRWTWWNNFYLSTIVTGAPIVALNIKNDEAHRLARELAEARGESLTEVVTAARLARLAYARFGKGVGDPPVLNLGDCLSYGIAMAEREPLLFKGDDFARTDVEAVAY